MQDRVRASRLPKVLSRHSWVSERLALLRKDFPTAFTHFIASRSQPRA